MPPDGGTASGALERAALGRIERLELGEDPVAELVTRPRKGERNVRMQTFQAPRVRARAADAEIELGA
jgi:hypothetical protein